MSRLEKELYSGINTMCPNFKNLRDDNKFINHLNSHGPVVKVVARFIYLASLTHSSVFIS